MVVQALIEATNIFLFAKNIAKLFPQSLLRYDYQQKIQKQLLEQ